MKTAIGYVRVSTTGQAEEGISLEAQAAKIQAWALANDYYMGPILVDAGLSGGRADNRPALQDALSIIECKSCEYVLVVYSLSRLARSTKDTIAIGERLEAAGADLVSLSEKIDTTSAAGKMIFRLLAVMAEFERDLVSERTTMALAHKKARGERVGAVPYGYASKDGTLVPHTGERTVQALAKQFRDSGFTLREIARELNARGLTARNGDEFHPQQIARMLNG